MEFQTISHLLGIGQSSAVTIMGHVSYAITSETPSETEIKTVIQVFRDRWGFQQCGGAIDGTHTDFSST